MIKTVRRMTPSVEIMKQLRMRVQQAVTTACELEVNYKCSLQIFGVLCFMIDDDEDNELVIKIQKKWCKKSLHDVGDKSEVTHGISTTHIYCDNNRTVSECCESNKQTSIHHKTCCVLSQPADNFPRSFRPIPSNELSYQRKMSIGSVSHGIHNHLLAEGVRPQSNLLCPFDLDSHSLRRPETVLPKHKEIPVKHCMAMESPYACRLSERTGEELTQTHPTTPVQQPQLQETTNNEPATCDALVTLCKSAQVELTDLGKHGGFDNVNQSRHENKFFCAVVCQKQPARYISESKPMPHPDRIMSTESDESYAGFTHCVAPAEEKKRSLFTSNEKFTTSTEKYSRRSMFSRKLFALASLTDAKIHSTTRMGRNGTWKVRKRTPMGGRGRRLSDRPVVGQRTMAQCFGITKNKRLTYTTEEQVELEHGGFARTMQRLLCRPPLRGVSTDGTLVDMSGTTHQFTLSVNARNIDKISRNYELDMSHDVTIPECRMNNGENCGVSTIWGKTRDNSTVTCLQCRQDSCHKSNTDWSIHKVANDNEKSKCGMVGNNSQGQENQFITLNDSAPEAIRVVSRYEDIRELHTSDKTEIAHIVSLGSKQYECEYNDKVEHQTVSHSSGIAELALTCHDKELIIPSNNVTGVILCNQCHLPDNEVFETASDSTNITTPVSQPDSCSNEHENKGTSQACCVDTSNKSFSVFDGMDIQIIPGWPTEKFQKSVVKSENTITECVLDELWNADSQKCHGEVDVGEPSNTCKHATDDGSCSEDSHSDDVMTLPVPQLDDSCRRVGTNSVPLQNELISNNYSLVTVEKCQDVCINSGCIQLPSDTQNQKKTDPQRDGVCVHPVVDPMTVKSHKQDLAPGKHVRNLFPQNSECAGFTGSKETVGGVHHGFPVNSLPALTMSDCPSKSPLASGSRIELQRASVSCISQTVTSIESLLNSTSEDISTASSAADISITKEESFPECSPDVLDTSDEQALVRRLVCPNEPVQVASPNRHHSVTTGTCMAYLLSPLTRPPIHRTIRKMETPLIPWVGGTVSNLMPTLTEDSSLRLCWETKHVMLPDHSKETYVQCQDGLVKGNPSVDCEQENVTLATVTDSCTDSLLTRCRLTGEKSQLKRTNPNFCSLEVKEAMPSIQRDALNSSTKYIQGDQISLSQPQPTSGASNTCQLNCVPCPNAKAHLTKESPCELGGGYSMHSRESCGACPRTCSCCMGASSHLGVTGSWTVVSPPDLSSSLAAASRPLVTVTSFSNIQFKDIRFNSESDKNTAAVCEIPQLPCAVKENHGFMRQPQIPRTARTIKRRSRWMWPANLLHSLSCKSRVVTKHHQMATPENVCVEKVKGRWSHK